MALADTYLSVLSWELGVRVRVRDLDDPMVRDNRGKLEKGSSTVVRVSDRKAAELAVAVILDSDIGFQAVVVCTDSLDDDSPTDWVRKLRAAAGLHSIRTLLVSGAACANFAAGLEVARGLIFAGSAVSVLLVTTDKVSVGTRYQALGATVIGDGAVACMVTTNPGCGQFRMVDQATETWAGSAGRLGHAKTMLTATRSAAKKVAGGDLAVVRHVVTPNFDRTTRQLLVMAASADSASLHPGLLSEVGHCFAADVPLNLHDLARSGVADRGHLVLTVSCGQDTVSVTVFEYFGEGGVGL
ncbi:hypothetical protein QM646_04945 [Rhodococcus erythropolis]|nr:hypothetical protein [Rhodococcus erythropolis]